MNMLQKIFSVPYEVHRERLIPCPRRQVFETVRDLRSWSKWSPWLMHEKEAQLHYSKDCDQEGGYYDWDGRYIGAGRLCHERIEQPERLALQLRFLRPFKSEGRVLFSFEEEGSKCRVRWSMYGRMPWFMRFFLVFSPFSLTDMIGMDYALGLAQLSGYLAPDSPHPRISFCGFVERAEQWAVTASFSGGQKAMGEAMTATYPQLYAALAEIGVEASGQPVTLYHSANIKADHFVCTMALPVAKDPGIAAFPARQLGAGRYFRVRLQGSYDFMELTWYAAMSHLRMHKIRFDKRRPSLEVYDRGPTEQDNSNSLDTSVLLAVR